MSATGIIPVVNETQSTASRVTKEGRKITYRMRVIQQPERARACGSGAKSSADRRPVDPPPIVELRVYEGANAETDITFSYKANFFLFATLENARHLAQGRVPTAAHQSPFPVLTGTPVAGMAYLDRPEPAGYFIFPDLSVRHEGKYRLSFSLYEELKERGDMDTETSDNVEQQRSAHVSHRLEVKSTPFTVFSAKKFPGLTESTQLSRIVAEQGCRVRIRRDVRMRRRGGDGKRDDFDDYDEAPAYDRGRATATPEGYNQHPMGTPQIPVDGMDRPRSSSNASNATNYMPQRRSSVEQISQTYQQSYAGSPVTPQTPQGMYPQAPVPNWHGQPQQSGSYMQPPPPPPSYPPQQNYQVQQSQPMAPPNYGYVPQYQSYEQGHARHNSVEYPQPPTGPPRTATPSQPMQQQVPQYQQPMQQYQNNGYAQQQQASPMPPSQPNMQPPMQSPVAPAYSAAPQPPAAPQYAPPPVPTAEPVQHQDYYDPNRVVPPKFAHQPQPSGATKRSYSSTFDTEALEQPLRHGARPSVTAHDPKYSAYTLDSSADDDLSLEDAAMSYRRADGTERRRRIPIIS